jgi:adenylate cyclase 1
VNVAGVFMHNLMEHAQRKAFLDTRNCIAARLEMEDENEKLVRRLLSLHHFLGVYLWRDSKWRF